MTNRYESTRAPWPDAGPWDRTVRYTRARTALGYPARTDVQERDGVPCLVDLDTNRSYPL